MQGQGDGGLDVTFAFAEKVLLKLINIIVTETKLLKFACSEFSAKAAQLSRSALQSPLCEHTICELSGPLGVTMPQTLEVEPSPRN